MKAIKIIILVIGAMVISGMVFADIPVARGGYADINVGYSKVVSSSYMDDVNGLGLNFDLGYKMMPFFGVELGYTTYGASKSSFTGASAIDGVIKAMLPFQEVGAELFAKLGSAYLTNGKLLDGVSQHATNVYYALGGDYALNPNMLVVLQWSQAYGNSNTGTFQLLSIGASYIF